MIRFVSAAALIVGVAACKAGSERNQVDTTAPAAAPAPAPAETARVDTASLRRDTTGGKTTSSAGNQTQSGVTNAKTGASTLGKGVKKAEPTQGQPVTSKGDTIAKPKKP